MPSQWQLILELKLVQWDSNVNSLQDNFIPRFLCSLIQLIASQWQLSVSQEVAVSLGRIFINQRYRRFTFPQPVLKFYPSKTNIRTRPACRLNNRSLHKHSASHARWQRLINSLNDAFVVWLTFIERLCSDQLWLLLSDSHTLSSTDWNQFPMCSWIHNKPVGNER